jgi:hypothetical protein
MTSWLAPMADRRADDPSDEMQLLHRSSGPGDKQKNNRISQDGPRQSKAKDMERIHSRLTLPSIVGRNLDPRLGCNTRVTEDSRLRRLKPAHVRSPDPATVVGEIAFESRLFRDITGAASTE